MKPTAGSFVRPSFRNTSGAGHANASRALPRFHSWAGAPIGLALLLTGGCVPVPRGDNPLATRFMTTGDLRDYSEEVFREQNRVTTRLMMAPLHADSISAEERRRVERAEARMNDACASLNRVASKRARGQDTDIELENKVRRNVRDCARETERLQALLDELEIGGD